MEGFFLCSSQNGFYTGFMYQTGNKFHFTPNNAIWSNKWVKIIAHDKIANLWSDPVYVQIRGVLQSTYSLPQTNSGITTQCIGYWSTINGKCNTIANYDKIPTVKYTNSILMVCSQFDSRILS